MKTICALMKILAVLTLLAAMLALMPAACAVGILGKCVDLLRGLVLFFADCASDAAERLVR